MKVLCDVVDGWMLYFRLGKHFVYLFILLLSSLRDKSFIIIIVKVHIILLHCDCFFTLDWGFRREKISLLYYFIIDVIICRCPSCLMTSMQASPTKEWSISSITLIQTPPSAIFCGPPTTELNFQSGSKRKGRDRKDLTLLSNFGERSFPNSKI